MNESESKETPGLFMRICDVLLIEWDPIGVGNSPEAVHEYDGYAQSIFEMILRTASREEIVNYLWWAETENIGLSGDRQKTVRIANRLATLRS